MDSSFPPPPKRHHSLPHLPPSTPSAPPALSQQASFPPHGTPPLQSQFSSVGETVFRILCPAIKMGSVIGKGGATVRHIREETGARIRVIDEPLPPRCDEHVILIAAPSSGNSAPSNYDGEGEIDVGEDVGREGAAPSPAQMALLRVLERILRVDDEWSERGEDHRRREEGGSGEEFGVCRLLAPSHQVGCVLGRGGKIVERIRQDTNAQIRVFPREQMPACASPGDELIQISGSSLAVKKALLLVSSCLQDNPRGGDPFTNRGHYPDLHAMDHHSRGYGSENIRPIHRIRPDEEEVFFKILCHVEKVGSLIGKGGSVVHAIENDTGASIKSTDTVLPDTEERVVVISAREQWEMQRSPAQDAVIRVHSRIAELGLEPNTHVIARLLVPPQQIGCLLGKGGQIVAEMRRLTGASIRIFGRDQGFKLGTHGDEIVQIAGSMPSVKDALFQITGRLREIVLRGKAPSFVRNGLQPLSPHFRPRSDPSSPGHYTSSVGVPHHHHQNNHLSGYEKHSASQITVHQHSTASAIDRVGGTSDKHSAYVPSFDRQNSPSPWNSQAAVSGNQSRCADFGRDLMSENECQKSLNRTVEVVVPLKCMIHVYGENSGNLVHLKQVSGANVVIQDPKPGATAGVMLISGTPKQVYFAQSLVHAFIFCGLPY